MNYANDPHNLFNQSACFVYSHQTYHQFYVLSIRTINDLENIFLVSWAKKENEE